MESFVLSAMSFNETDNEVEAILRTLAGEYAISTESEQVEFLTEVLQNIDDLQEVLQPLKEIDYSVYNVKADERLMMEATKSTIRL